MNDFTKEELESLRDYINYAVSHSYGPTADKVDVIYNKIESMIDNYCEHDPTLNELQVKTINAIKSLINECHHIDVVIRHNGIDRMFEADFLKPVFKEIKC